MTYTMYDLIGKKRDKFELTKEEIKFWVDGYVKGDIPDYQSSAMLMAIYLNGMTEMETNYLVDAMVYSGDVLDLSAIDGIKVDKHSSGGVGDKTTLIVAPILAAGGLKVAKMSGRGLGHTGGTLDKMEAIPGLHVDLTAEEFVAQVKKIGIAVIAQSANLVPADKKLYHLRDVTATVGSLPLIAASIMSKKLATGSEVIVLDVKYGTGAFMETKEDALELATAMVKIGTHYGRKTAAVLSNMSTPLGKNVGNALEVDEAVAVLNGEGSADLKKLVLVLAGEIIHQINPAAGRLDAFGKAERVLEHGKAWRCFLEMVQAQGGDVSVFQKGPLTQAPYVIKLPAVEEGYIKKIDALAVGNAARNLGAGRAKIDDVLDYNAGIVLEKTVGDYVEKGDTLAYIYASDILKATQVGEALLDVVEMSADAVTREALIYGIVDANGFTHWADALKK